MLYSGLPLWLYSALVLLAPASRDSSSCSGSCSLSYRDFSRFVVLTVAVRVLVYLTLSFPLPSLGPAQVVFLVRCRSPLISPVPGVPPHTSGLLAITLVISPRSCPDDSPRRLLVAGQSLFSKEQLSYRPDGLLYRRIPSCC